jgi:WD40 repeat protein
MASPSGVPLLGQQCEFSLGFKVSSCAKTARLRQRGSHGAAVGRGDRPTPRPAVDRPHAVNAVTFSPHGKLLATAGKDRTVQLWNPAFTSWMETGCKLVNRNMSLTEWNQLAADFPYERTCPDLPAGPNAPSYAPTSRYQ